MDETMTFSIEQDHAEEMKTLLKIVYDALKEKGYNPVNQIVGYIMSGDPTYITSYNSARSMICRLERDEIIEELVRSYLDTHTH